ncbi:endonuclease/Exonuclease/phosphatase [Colletotrichum eremochloae]|uniref:Putative endonuclease/Exonuclease/phosphatase n=1 Tax=Colletotrichum sublineola TaxID=1173701 RepID=A0A066XRD5_COLSU|nr:endonuclease/Exonuclease/phosphatase [Colletotrichum sublineola]KAK2017854.1 endonuclease/Exonuclease/phosphatase [Colletotrichum eremochloae]KDN70239.1 putative endonuclease/Exonuclease/phosphatase [Colletotrichum sublineola]
MLVKLGSPEMEAAPSMLLRIVTQNVRYATEHPTPKEKPWSVRGPKLCNQLDFITSGHESAFICLQEVLYSQIEDVRSYLGPAWGYIGLGRDDGKRRGEFSPVFYQVDRWKCERNETLWLSKTPQKPSRGWDAALNRIVTIGEFLDKATDTRVVVMSTHFDHQGVVAREESAKLLLKIAREWGQGANGKPPTAVLLAGDFNSTPEDNAYKTMVAPDSGMVDVSTQVPEEKRYGNKLTYTSFDEPDEEPLRIDFLFVKEPSPVTVKTFGVLSNKFDDDVYLSDHRPVVADIEIPVLRTGETS